jgi:hypothetical protein
LIFQSGVALFDHWGDKGYIKSTSKPSNIQTITIHLRYCVWIPYP